eukprot:TRINITY_DN14850_c2_g1_i2.p1 TRINITY_DN14850_c2_g1~~TRINITY_DN14850_c2_g1_i2.p1  ORF type:complete len:389 (+),score=82.37 TRINITY_DN14850_c2_g1_i2:87-1169(+)
MSVAVAATAQAPRQQQLVLLDVQRRWIAGMVAKGHKGGGWFKVKERALMKNQTQKMQAVDPEMQAEVAADLMGLLREQRLVPWAPQLANVGITTLLALRNVASESELPRGMPPPARRVLLSEVERMNGVTRNPNTISPSVSPASSPSVAPVQSPPLSTHSTYQRAPIPSPPQPAAQPIYVNPAKTQSPAEIDAVAIHNPNGADIYKQAMPDEMAELVPQLEVCGVNGCTRKFTVNRVEKHRLACGTGKQRKQFEIKVVGDEAVAAKSNCPVEKKQPRWREQSNSFRAACRMEETTEPPVDQVVCPTCSRSFNQSVAERHIPSCAERQRNSSNRRPPARSTSSPPTRTAQRPSRQFRGPAY